MHGLGGKDSDLMLVLGFLMVARGPEQTNSKEALVGPHGFMCLAL